MGNYYGIDIGGTTIKIGLFQDSTLRQTLELPTDTGSGGQNIIPDIARCLTQRAEGAAMGVPGAVLADGTVNRCVNLGWGLCHPGREFTALTGIPCRVCNDANAAAVGEQWQGGGAGFDSVALVTLGTGVGAGIVLHGQLLAGAHGSAGELGHICVNPRETSPCSCGNFGCLEQYCSAPGLTKLAVQAGLGSLSPKELFLRAEAGERAARAVTDQACDILGRGIAAFCSVLDPDVVVLGGGVSQAGEFLRSSVETAFQRYVFHASRDIQIRLAVLGNQAGMYGAARLAMEI
jgi:glucokinase